MHTKIVAVLLVVAALAAVSFIVSPARSAHLQQEQNLEIVFQSISGILRTGMNTLSTVNNTIYVGDATGAVSTWVYDDKKKKLEFQDISRPVEPILPPSNPVVGLSATSEGIAVLTSNNRTTIYSINSAFKITGKIETDLPALSQILLITVADSPIPFIVGIPVDRKNVCLYKLQQSLVKPNPVQQLICANNPTANVSFSGLSYDPLTHLVAAGDETQAVLFTVNTTDISKALTFLTATFLPKVDTKGFKSVFTKNSTLLTVNDLWLSSIIIDVSVPSAKIIASERTQKLVKSGETTSLSVAQDDKSKQSTVIINSKGKMQAYTLGINNKLTFKNESRLLGKSQNFMLHNQQILFAIQNNELAAVKVGDSQQKDYLSIADSESISSHNHFTSVENIISWNNSVVVSMSDGGKNNLKLWQLTENKLNLLDQKTFTFFSLLKSGDVSLKAGVMMPPPVKSNANATLHIAVAGSEPYYLIIITLNAQNKIGTVSKSKQQHNGNITVLMMSADQKNLVTGSLDGNIKVWTISQNREQVEDNSTITISPRYGPIRGGFQNKAGDHFVFGHSSTYQNPLVNITIWTTDSKKGLVKVAQNVPGEAHESNLTAILLSHDQKYIVSLSESGELRLWRHQGWTMVDLLASLSLGFSEAAVTMTNSNHLLIETSTTFTEYAFDFNGFILTGRTNKQYVNRPGSNLVLGNKILSGDEDGSIRIYSLTQ